MKVVLSIAGSDSSGGAGIQADIKTAEYFGVFATTAITALTAQNTKGVNAIFPIDPKFIIKQIEAVLNDFDVDVIKVGMLGNKEIAQSIKPILQSFKKQIVLDPVAFSRAGSQLLHEEAKIALIELFCLADIVTPNHLEAKYFGLDMAKTKHLKNVNFLIKNVEHEGSFAVDKLFINSLHVKDFITPFAQKQNTHGTGCTYSMAIACNLALGHTLINAIKISKDYIYQAITSAPNLGSGNGPILHKIKKVTIEDIKAQLKKNQNLINKIEDILSLIEITFTEDNQRKLLFTTYLKNGISHFLAINLMVYNKLYTSAGALVRVFFENIIRCEYSIYIFDDNKIDEMFTKQESWNFPKLKTMCDELDECFKYPMYSNIMKKEYGVLCDYTHSSNTTIARWFNEKGLIEPTFTNSEILDLLKGNYFLMDLFAKDYIEFMKGLKLLDDKVNL